MISLASFIRKAVEKQIGSFRYSSDLSVSLSEVVGDDENEVLEVTYWSQMKLL
jgi:hypothetical protein